MHLKVSPERTLPLLEHPKLPDEVASKDAVHAELLEHSLEARTFGPELAGCHHYR